VLSELAVQAGRPVDMDAVLAVVTGEGAPSPGGAAGAQRGKATASRATEPASRSEAMSRET
jgi:pyruvate/2-oxoglutarate dehydrogenase complex dihydrolipoamide acyltransferase (E2) component